MLYEFETKAPRHKHHQHLQGLLPAASTIYTKFKYPKVRTLQWKTAGMNEGTFASWISFMTATLSLVYLAGIMAIPIPDYDINAIEVDFDLNKTAVGSITAFPEGYPCTDDLGRERSDGSSWISTSGCDRNYCVHGWKNNYTLSYKCRTLGEVENRNAINCFVASDKLASFPYCCPHIECERRNMTSVPTLPECHDLSPSSACEIWAKHHQGCSPTSNVYNITSKYCNATCKFCTP